MCRSICVRPCSIGESGSLKLKLRIDPQLCRVILARGEIEGDLRYDYLIVALGRRPATEQITGFFEYSHHLMTIEGALKFGEALRNFHEAGPWWANVPERECQFRSTKLRSPCLECWSNAVNATVRESPSSAPIRQAFSSAMVMSRGLCAPRSMTTRLNTCRTFLLRE